MTYGRTDKHNECRTVFFASTIYNCMLTSFIILLQHFGSKLARVVQVTINILPSSTFQFKFASSLDCFLITMGVLFALCGGAGGPILMVMFGVTIQVLSIGIPFLSYHINIVHHILILRRASPSMTTTWMLGLVQRLVTGLPWRLIGQKFWTRLLGRIQSHCLKL